MKFSEYVQNLNQFLQENPDSAEFEVVTSSDDEGNSYSRVHFEPSIGMIDGDEFTPDVSDPNAVCVN